MKTWPIVVCAFGLVLGVLSTRSMAAADEPSAQALPLWASAGDPKPASQALAALRSGKLGTPENFVAKARLAFTLEQREMTAASTDLALESPVSESLPPHWRARDGVYTWRSEQLGVPLELPIVMPRSDGFDPARYDEVWIDYRALPGVDACYPQFTLSLARTGADGQARFALAYSGSGTAMKPLWTNDLLTAHWHAKGPAYLLGRALDLGGDADWRYAQERDLAVLQRRMRVPLHDAEAIEIATRPGVAIEQVNVRVAGSGGEPGQVVQFPGLARSGLLADGEPGVRIDLADALLRLGLRNATMREIVVFVPGDARSVVQSGALRHVAVLGPDGGPSGDAAVSIVLHGRSVDESAGRERIRVDLRPLERAAAWRARSASLRLVPPAGASACAVAIDRVRAVSAFVGSIPAYVVKLDEWARKSGSPLAFDMQRGMVESPGFVGYLPFSALTAHAETRLERGGARAENRTQADLASPERETPGSATSESPANAEPPSAQAARDTSSPTIRTLVSAGGATLTAAGEMPHAVLDHRRLRLEGRSDALVLSWPVEARVAKSAWFRLGVPVGADRIAALELTAQLADGRKIVARIAPNQPYEMRTGAAEIRNVTLRIVPSTRPFVLELDYLAILDPATLPVGSALTIPMPAHELLTPQPAIRSGADSVLDAGAGRLRGLLATDPPVFSTALEPAIDEPEGLRLEYRLPAGYLGEDHCPLTLTFDWERGTTTHAVCFNQPEGSLFMPTADFLEMPGPARSMGALKSVEWRLRAPHEPAPGATFALDFAFEGWTMQSTADRLRLSPLLFAGRRPLYARPADIDALVSTDFTRAWVTLPDTAMQAVMRGQDLRPAEHRLFTVDRVVADPRKPLSIGEWVAATTIPTAPPESRWPKWAILVAIVALSWLAWRRGVSWPGRLSRATWCALLALRDASARPGPARLLRGAYLAFAIPIVAAAAWLAGRAEWTFPAWMALTAIALITRGMDLQLRGARGEERTFRRICRTAAIGIVTWAVAVVWSLGRSGLSADLAWTVWPLLASAYVGLPVLPALAAAAVERHARAVELAAWTLGALLLYAGGAVIPQGADENYLFTFGGLCAVFALRALLRVFEPAARRYRPRVAERIYGTAGGVYFSAGLLALAVTAVLLAVGQATSAEQLAVIVYFALALGVLRELWSRRAGVERPTVQRRRAGDLDADRTGR